MRDLDGRSLDIITQMRRYLAREMSLRDLEDWIVPNLGRLLVETSPTIRGLAGTIELGLAELSAGDLDEEGFRRMLEDFERLHPIVFVSDSPIVTLSSNSSLPVETLKITFGVSESHPVRYERIPL